MTIEPDLTSPLPPAVQELVDKAAISDVLDRYAIAIDTQDFDLLATVFAPDANLDYTAIGGPAGPYREVAAWLQQALAPLPMTQHLIGNRQITVDGATARCYSCFFNPVGRSTEDGQVINLVGGWYRDELARTADGWRIVRRVEETAWKVDERWPSPLL